jgi:Metallo-peptidase family M12
MIKIMKHRLLPKMYVLIQLFFGGFSIAKSQCYSLNNLENNEQLSYSFPMTANSGLPKKNVLNYAFLLRNQQQRSTIKIKRHLVHLPLVPFYPTVSDSLWEVRLLKLNAAFLSTGLQFEYAGTVNEISSNEFYDYNLTTDWDLFLNDSLHVLNVYVVSEIIDREKKFSGWATGGIPQYSASYAGGTKLRNNFVMTYKAMKNCLEDYVFAHEIGHLFGLLHTFESNWGKELVTKSNSTFTGDFITDTEANDTIFGKNQAANIECDEEYINEGLHQDCYGSIYKPDLDNIMSYYWDGGTMNFTPNQLNKINEIADNFRGDLLYPTWCQVNIPWHESYENLLYEVGKIITFSPTKKKNAGQFFWEFSGGTPLDPLTNETVRVRFDDFGTFTYKLKVKDFNGQNEYETLPQEIVIEDRQLISKPLPIVETFENGFPGINTGWDFKNYNRDCHYFIQTSKGAFGKSQKSIVKRSFPVNVVDNDRDYFETPIFSLKNLSSCTVTFDYAYANKSTPGDTLRIYYLNNNDWLEFYKKGGAELQTTLNQVSQSEFIPSNTEWVTAIVDASSLISTINTKATRFAFEITTKKGNRFYIDNISIRGTSVTSLQATFNRSNHIITLNWPNFAMDETNYVIEKQKDAYSPWEIVDTVDPDVTTWNELATVHNSISYYQVRALSPTVSNPSNKAAVYVPDVPLSPRPLTVTVSGRNATVIWNDPNVFETNYDLYYGYDKNKPMQLLKELGASPSSTAQYVVSNLPPNTQVYFMARARELNFTSLPSDTAEAIIAVQPVISRVQRVESFFDNLDPGLGNGFQFYSLISNEYAHSVATIPVTQLADGVHTITIRARDSKGYWSQMHTSPFLKVTRPNEAVRVESMQYSIDANPGGAVWYDVYIGPGVQALEGIIVPLDIVVSTLADGIHFLTIRVKDNQGFTSNYYHNSFLKLSSGPSGSNKVISLEYTLDNGLLIGSGTAVSLTSGNYINQTIDLPPLTNGKHILSIRAKDEAGYSSNISLDSFLVNDQAFCTINSNIYYNASYSPSGYFTWQYHTGVGWRVIQNSATYEGAGTQNLKIISPPTSWYGRRYRCLVNGIADPEFILKFSNTWTGATNTDWFNPENWSCNAVPDEFVDVIINSDATRFPTLNGANGVCRSLHLKTGASISVETGVQLDIQGK